MSASLAVCLTVHNRKVKTLECLERLFVAIRYAGVGAEIFVTDDGSTDGTSAAVTARWPDARILLGDGTLFWNRGMARAVSAAAETAAPFLLWLNDDTLLDETAIATLLSTYACVATTPAIVVGTILDADRRNVTYGGLARIGRFHPFKYRRIAPEGVAVACDTFNGNCVLVPREILERVGSLDATFHHAYGDIDYGLRARLAGVRIWATGVGVGVCNLNDPTKSWAHPSHSLRVRWRRMLAPTGMPPSDQLVFARRHGGLLWPVWFALPYLRILVGRVPREYRRRSADDR